MNSETDVANTALAMVGESIIYSLNDETKPARECRRHYEAVRDEVLSDHRWGFAKKQAMLTASATPPLARWDMAFQLPTDFIRLCLIEEEDVWLPRQWFDIMGKDLVMNVEDEDATVVCIEYIFQNKQVTTWSPKFKEAVATKLASRIARSITGQNALGSNLDQQFDKIMASAKTIDSRQRASNENSLTRNMFAKSNLLRARL